MVAERRDKLDERVEVAPLDNMGLESDERGVVGLEHVDLWRKLRVGVS